MPEIPIVNFSDFKKLKASEIKEMKSVQVTSDGELLFTAIIAPQGAGMAVTDNINTQAEFIGARGNSVGGKDPDAFIRIPV